MEWPQHQSNSTGVFLEITEGRSLYFTPRENLIFGYLFDLADTDDDGLVGANDGGHALLGRAGLPPSTLQRLWLEAGGERPEECLARPQWFVLLALVALAQAGLPCTLRDLLHTCDVASPPSQGQPFQQKQQQRQQQQQQSSSSGGVGDGKSNPGRLLRPIPDFFLDGGIPPSLPSSPGPSAQAQASASAAGVGGQQWHGGGGEMSGRGPKSSHHGGRGQQQQQQQQGRVEAWGYGGVGGTDVQGRPGGGAGAGAGVGAMAPTQADAGAGYQLEVTVYSHRVVGEGYSSHTEYTVLANASLPGFARREMEVARRFSDFRWLHSCFQAIPGVLPPPLPPSKWAGSSSRDFVAERMKGLQRYITRVAQHPILSRHYAFQVFLEGTPRGLKAAKALLPSRIPGAKGRCYDYGSSYGHGGSAAAAAWGDTFSPTMAGGGGTPVSPGLSSTPSTTPPDESAGFVRRRFCLGGADDMLVPGGGAGGVVVTGIGAGVGAGGAGASARQGKRRSVSFGASSDEGSCHGGAGCGQMVSVGTGGGGGGWAGSATGWPLSVVANAGYEAYGNYMSTSVSTSLTSIKGVFGAVKTKAKSAVGLGAGPAPITVEQDPLYEAEVARIEDLVAPVAGAVKIMESAAVLKRGVGYEMSRLGHYLTQVASLEDTDGLPARGVSPEEFGGSEADKGLAGDGRTAVGLPTGGGAGGSSSSGRAGWTKAEQVLGQRMERVATAWLEAIDQEESDFLDPLREQLGYLGSAKEVHRGRGRSLDELQAANASLQRNKQRLHAARAHGDAHMASVSTGKMEAAEERMTCAHTRAGLITKTFKDEARRFHECRKAEGVLAVRELAKAQAHFARKANAAWKQVLEDINPTDDELRESQQRVRLPKREAIIAEGGRRGGSSSSSSSTAGVIGGWLGAAATVGLSTASAGLSTVTGVAGATASVGLSTVTGVAGAVTGLAAGAAGGAGKSGQDAVEPRAEEVGVAAATSGRGAAAQRTTRAGGAGAGAGAAAPAPSGTVAENTSGGALDPVSNGVLRAEDGGGGIGQLGEVGHDEFDGKAAVGRLALHGSPPSVPPVPLNVDSRSVNVGGVDGGRSATGRGEESVNLQDVDVEVTTTTLLSDGAAGVEAAVFSHPTQAHQITDGSWELNIERPPPEALAEQMTGTSGVSEVKSEEEQEPPSSTASTSTSAARLLDGEGPGSSPPPPPPPSGTTKEDGSSKSGKNCAGREACGEAGGGGASKAKNSGDSGGSGGDSSRGRRTEEEEEVEAWAGAAAVGWPSPEEEIVAKASAPGGDIVGQLVSLSLDEETSTTTMAPSSSSSASPPPEPKGDNSSVHGGGVMDSRSGVAGAAGGRDGRSGSSASTSRGPATTLSLMDSLEALSSSGADSASSGGSGGVGLGGGAGGGGKKEGNSQGGNEGNLLELSSGVVVVAGPGGEAKPPQESGSEVRPTSSTSTETGAGAGESGNGKAEQSKQRQAGVAEGSEPLTAGGSGGSSSSGGSGSSSEAEESKPNRMTSSADSSAVSDGGGVVPADTAVVRLAGSPSPPHGVDGRVGESGSAVSGGGGGGGGDGGSSRAVSSPRTKKLRKKAKGGRRALK